MAPVGEAPARPQLYLQFASSLGRTRLQHRHVSYPYAVTSALDLDNSPRRLPTVIVQSVSGGIFEGERLRQYVSMRDGAGACVTTQGATVVHSMRGDRYAEVQAAIGLEATSYLEYRPHPLVLFPGSRLRQRLKVRLGQGALIVLSEGFVGHDPARGERSFAWLDSSVEAHDEDGRLLAADRIRVAGSTATDALPGVSRGVRAHGSVLAVAASPRTGVARTVRALAAALGSLPELYSGVSALRDDLGFLVRITAKDGGAMRSGLETALAVARQSLLEAKDGQHVPS